MSGDMLLLFLDAAARPAGWFLLRNGAVRETGGADRPLPAAPRAALAVPGADVAVRWLDLPPGLTIPQAAAAARLAAADLAAEPPEDLHVAAGPHDEAAGARPVAFVARRAMDLWLGAAAELGIDPVLVLPAPLLLAPPAAGLIVHEGADPPLYRGPRAAFALEPALAALLHPDGRPERVGQDRLCADAAAILSAPPLDLRQGDYARRRGWLVERDRAGRLALLAALLLLVTLAVQLGWIWRYARAADALEAETAALTAAGDPARLLAGLGGGPGSHAALSAALFGAVRDTPHIALSALAYERSAGLLRATILADDEAAVSALVGRLAARGFAVDPGPLRRDDGRRSAEIVVRAP